jgi:hypothetical protein
VPAAGVSVVAAAYSAAYIAAGRLTISVASLSVNAVLWIKHLMR